MLRSVTENVTNKTKQNEVLIELSQCPYYFRNGLIRHIITEIFEKAQYKLIIFRRIFCTRVDLNHIFN